MDEMSPDDDSEVRVRVSRSWRLQTRRARARLVRDCWRNGSSSVAVLTVRHAIRARRDALRRVNITTDVVSHAVSACWRAFRMTTYAWTT